MAGYGTGQIRIYEAVTGILHAEVNAHARWIYSLDIAPFSGLVSAGRRHLNLTLLFSFTSNLQLNKMFLLFLNCVQLLSAAEDSLVRVWHLSLTPESNSVEVNVVID